MRLILSCSKLLKAKLFFRDSLDLIGSRDRFSVWQLVRYRKTFEPKIEACQMPMSAVKRTARHFGMPVVFSAFIV
jgi:hypothetical protein